jgi:hypothetical protein
MLIDALINGNLPKTFENAIKSLVVHSRYTAELLEHGFDKIPWDHDTLASMHCMAALGIEGCRTGQNMPGVHTALFD